MKQAFFNRSKKKKLKNPQKKTRIRYLIIYIINQEAFIRVIIYYLLTLFSLFKKKSATWRGKKQLRSPLLKIRNGYVR